MTTGQRIKAARIKAGLTQKELGKRLGVAYQTLAQWENDLRKPKYETIQRILDALGISFPELMGMKPDNDGTWITWEKETIEGIEDFIRSYDGRIRAETAMALMTEEGQNKVADYAEDILPRYRRQDAPEPSPPPSDSKDAAAGENPVEGLEKPGEGE